MLAKRKRRVASSPQGLAAGESLKRGSLPSHSSSWHWVGSEVSDPSNITLKHLLQTCGFTLNSHPNRYAPSQDEVRSKSSDIPDEVVVKNGELQDELIVISDDEEDKISCNKKTCESNPNCLNYLGQENWENEEKLERTFLEAAKLGKDPNFLSRKQDIPVGLKNLGATCYANASLQVWFRDVAFRAGVYDCQPTDAMGGKFKESPIFQLQVTFAALQYSNQNVYNPIKLVESLQLRKSEQQDAQEFSKLFMSHLDAEFQKQSSPAVKSLITDQFQGSQIYGTICHTCQSRSERQAHFLEIEVSFEKNCSLQGRLAALLEKETLSGDNKYLCPHCHSLQDATRYTEFKQLPPVLHFSLLRFVFDVSKMERKKSKHAITFPRILNMDRFLGTSEQRARSGEIGVQENLYELRGILLHKGISAYHGHYEAQVYDDEKCSWFQFNDDIVTNITQLGDKTTERRVVNTNIENEDLPNKQVRKRAKVRTRQRIDDSDDDVLLVQENIKGSTVSLTTNGTVTSKDAYMLIYARKSTAVPPPPASSSANLNVDIKTAPCPPTLALEIVSRSNSAHDETCEAYEKKRKDIKIIMKNTRKKVMEIYRSWNILPPTKNSVVISQQSLKDWLSRHCTEVPLMTLETPMTSGQSGIHGQELLMSSQQCIPNDEIVCVHRKLDPMKAENMKIMNKQMYERIVHDTNCIFSPVLEPSDVCGDCVKAIFKERLYDYAHPKLVKTIDSLCSSMGDCEGYWISKKWFKDWRLLKPKMHIPSEGDPAPDSDEFGHHVRCEHGNLSHITTNRCRISQTSTVILKELFPSWNPIPTNSEVCAVCETLIHVSKETKRGIRKQSEEEKAMLRQLYDDMTEDGFERNDDDSYAILPVQFVRVWRQWLNNPSGNQRPEKLDNATLLCEHNKLIFDPNDKSDVGSALCIVSRKDWDTLESFYSAGPLISLERCYIESGKTKLEHEIPVCADCRFKRRMNWTTAEIVVQLCSRSSLNTSRFLKPQKAPVTCSRKIGGRHSKRLRQSNMSSERRRLTVTKSTSVKEIKIMIQDLFNIPTICQRLSHHDQVIEDNAATIEMLEILAGDILHLQEEPETIGLDSEDDVTPPTKRRKEGMGFCGTLLGENMDTPTVLRENNSHASIPHQKPCSMCTFFNTYDALTCTVCNTTFK